MMKKILNEIIAKVETYKDDKAYKHYDDYYKAGVCEGIDRVTDVIKDYLKYLDDLDKMLRTYRKMKYVGLEEKECGIIRGSILDVIILNWGDGDVVCQAKTPSGGLIHLNYPSIYDAYKDWAIIKEDF